MLIYLLSLNKFTFSKKKRGKQKPYPEKAVTTRGRYSRRPEPTSHWLKQAFGNISRGKNMRKSKVVKICKTDKI